ncbi:MAG: rhodanese-related sulfurtransferase [Saprospirales bacterium]|nr:rhodanese-related sulfurtransferase [Saprospirales bacterium]MBK8921539.1 rhodanese-related sulfurtransferase [Saprospirales bacterium]
MPKFFYNRVNRRALKEQLEHSAEQRTTISFYQYVDLKNPAFFRDHLYGLLGETGVLGRIYVAREGVNAQISVPTANLSAFKAAMNSISFFQGIRLNIAIEDGGKSFFALIIKVRRKIVADGIEDPAFDPSDYGRHLSAEAFNALTDDPDTILVDMRNHYESEVGHFKGAITPDVDTFREELPYVADLLATQKDKNIVMYCTGGIRCEKASAYLKYRGFPNVFQLEGGIIEYARQVKARGLPNKFLGKNFVFDERLGERIGDTVIAHCHQCGAPCDDHTNCANEYCHILFIQCPGCRAQYGACCSEQCRDFMRLPAETRKDRAKTLQFNGSRFSKGHYKAFRKSERQPLVTG